MFVLNIGIQRREPIGIDGIDPSKVVVDQCFDLVVLLIRCGIVRLRDRDDTVCESMLWRQ